MPDNNEHTQFLQLIELLKSQPDPEGNYFLHFGNTVVRIDQVDVKAGILLQHFGETFPEASMIDALNAFMSASFWLQFACRVGGPADDETEDT